MKTKKQSVKEAYIKPFIRIFNQFEVTYLMAASPAVRPGGGGSGRIKVIEATDDTDDDELEG